MFMLMCRKRHMAAWLSRLLGDCSTRLSTAFRIPHKPLLQHTHTSKPAQLLSRHSISTNHCNLPV
jgi:hypothetical protein